MRDARGGGAFMVAGGGGVFVFERCASGMSAVGAATSWQRLFSNKYEELYNETSSKSGQHSHFSTVTSNTSTLFGGMSPVRCAP